MRLGISEVSGYLFEPTHSKEMGPQKNNVGYLLVNLQRVDTQRLVVHIDVAV